MRRPNAARQMSPTANGNGGDASNSKEQPMSLRARRKAPRTQMGAPHLRVGGDKASRPAVEWMKAISICLSFVLGFAIFVWSRHSRHMMRQSANFSEMDRCDLTTYPLWQIEQLKELNLSDCKKINLPADSDLWKRLSSLKKLDLNNNALRDLPAEMGALSSLEILFLSDNSLESVPIVIGKLKSLRVLSLRSNLIQELSATHLPSQLVWLILTNNKIGNINANINGLKFLRKLMLSHNEIESIPVELGACKDLELVRLANNNISTIPREVLTLPKLAWISLSANPISTPPKKVEKVINESDIQMQSNIILGSGASGEVYQAKYDGKDVAVKMFKEQSKGSDGNAADEAAINGLINHPLAISAIGVIPGEDEGGYKGMVMDLLSGSFSLGKVPSFDTVTRDEGPAAHSETLTKEQVHSVIYNIASVLEYIHSSIGVSHGDIYLHNVLRDGSYVARLSDWGASFVYDRDNAESAAMFERIEVLAFGRLVQNLYQWHLNIAIPDSTAEATTSLGMFRGKMKMNEMKGGPLTDLIASILQPDQASRPTFREIKDKLENIPEFKNDIVS